MAKKTTDKGTSEGLLEISRTYKEGAVVTKEDTDVEVIEVKTYPGVPLAKVRAGSRMTINLGNYESVQISVEVELPTPVEELSPAYVAAKAFVDDKMGTEVSACKQFRQDKASA